MKRRTQAEWLSLIAEFEASDQTQTAFCKARSINPNYFSLRRSQLKASSHSEFVRAVRPPSGETAPIVLHCGNVSIHLHAGFSTASLLELIRALA